MLDEPAEGLDGPTVEALVPGLLDSATGRGVLQLTFRRKGLDLVDVTHELRHGGRVSAAGLPVRTTARP